MRPQNDPSNVRKLARVFVSPLAVAFPVAVAIPVTVAIPVAVACQLVVWGHGSDVAAESPVVAESPEVAESSDVAESPPGDVFAGTGESNPPAMPYPDGEPNGEPGEVPLGNPFGVEVRGAKVWLTTVDDQCVWLTTTDGDPIRRVAGNGTKGYSGDGGPATEAQFNWPHEVRVAESGDLYIADTRNHVIRVVRDATGLVETIAGNGEEGFAGDGESGDAVRFRQPHSVVLDGDGVLVADTLNHRLRRIDLTTGIVTTVAGTGERRLPEDGELAATAPLFGPRSLAIDAKSIWIALREGNSIWRIDRNDGRLHHVAGTGKKGYSGDGGPAAEATFNGPKGLTIDAAGRLLVVDTENHVVRRIDLVNDVVETVLRDASMKRPHGIAPLVGAGFLVADSEHHRVLIGGGE